MIQDRMGSTVSWKANGTTLVVGDMTWMGDYNENCLKGFRSSQLKAGDVFHGQTYKTQDGVNYEIDCTVSVTVTELDYVVEFDQE